MPHQIILPSDVVQQELDWAILRKGISNCIQTVAPLARVYSRWPLKYDIGKTVALINSKKDGGRIHSWIIKVTRAIPSSAKAGGYELEWDLTIAIWGFLGYLHGEDDSNTHNEIETEARKIAQVLYVNKKHFGMDNTSSLKDVGYLRFEDIDVHGFGESDVHVAQGELSVTLRETFSQT